MRVPESTLEYPWGAARPHRRIPTSPQGEEYGRKSRV